MAIRFNGDVVFVNLIGQNALYYGLFDDRNFANTYFTAPIGSPDSRIVLYDNRPYIVNTIRKIHEEKLDPEMFAFRYEYPAHITIQEVSGIINIQASPFRTYGEPYRYLYLGLIHDMDLIPRGSRTLFEFSNFIRVPGDDQAEASFKYAFATIIEADEDTLVFE